MRNLSRLSLPARELVSVVFRAAPEQRALPGLLVAMSKQGFRISQVMAALSEAVDAGWLERASGAGREPDRVAPSQEALSLLSTARSA